MVRPTTAWPSRASMAATVELSTPPLIATAMGASGMGGNPAQVRHGGFDGVHQGVHLGGGVVASEGEAHAGAGAVGAEAEGGEDVRRREGAARAGRAGRDRETAQ